MHGSLRRGKRGGGGGGVLQKPTCPQSFLDFVGNGCLPALSTKRARVSLYFLEKPYVCKYGFISTVQYSNCGRGSQTSALASEPQAHEGAQRPQ
jgi:hypothetical protein